ncbi:hypothetical protein E1B28_001106 [Marasmius oreades]|uniref:Uncharacterized protein n=1 Tax=Marasmius oreades TaxID=181124 RepID=A0A9P7V2W9_9AGAR|nr:uncharacterized protein E1B28_001106 [Marasmius oreades]KAG7099243.1 hypothetical protein E1B28_001106 [Marasmius oreades]
MKRTALVSILVLSVAAQGFVPNPAWRNASITTSPEERIAVAKDALDVTLSMMVDEKGQLKFEDTNYGAAANLFAQMAQFDGFTNQSIYRNQLLNLFPQAEIFRPNFTHSSPNDAEGIPSLLFMPMQHILIRGFSVGR